ncbi:hypothetical protein CCYA_CCYA13G3625 [Cyanidiococcus yangmingshanensis]|nr:hypothetical protein CCYA_CCYA13G3625 [Cyanidiococcus yangmingshanensis]
MRQQQSLSVFSELLSRTEQFMPPISNVCKRRLRGRVKLLVSLAAVGDTELISLLRESLREQGRRLGEHLYRNLVGTAAVFSEIHRCSTSLSSFLVGNLWDDVFGTLSACSVVSHVRVPLLYSEVILLGMLVHEHVINASSLLVMWHLLMRYYSRSWRSFEGASCDGLPRLLGNWTLHAAIDIAFIAGDLLASSEPGSPLYLGLYLFKESLRRALWEGVFVHHHDRGRAAEFPSERTLAERAETFVDALDRRGPIVLRRGAPRAVEHDSPELEIDFEVYSASVDGYKLRSP